MEITGYPTLSDDLDREWLAEWGDRGFERSRTDLGKPEKGAWIVAIAPAEMIAIGALSQACSGSLAETGGPAHGALRAHMISPPFPAGVGGVALRLTCSHPGRRFVVAEKVRFVTSNG